MLTCIGLFYNHPQSLGDCSSRFPDLSSIVCMILLVVPIEGNADAHPRDRFTRSVVDHAAETADVELVLFVIVGVAALTRLANLLGEGHGISEGELGEARKFQSRN